MTTTMEYTYPEWVISLAATRGYDDAAHRAALDAQDVDQVSLTHPYNWLTEDEVEGLS